MKYTAIQSIDKIKHVLHEGRVIWTKTAPSNFMEVYNNIGILYHDQIYTRPNITTYYWGGGEARVVYPYQKNVTVKMRGENFDLHDGSFNVVKGVEYRIVVTITQYMIDYGTYTREKHFTLKII